MKHKRKRSLLSASEASEELQSSMCSTSECETPSPQKRRKSSKQTDEEKEKDVFKEESLSPKKNKKSPKHKKSFNNVDDEDPETDVAKDETDQLKSEGELSKADLGELLRRVAEVAPPHDHYGLKKRLAAFLWDDVRLDGYTAEFCKQQWFKAINSVKKTRTMAEISAAAVHLNETGKLMSYLPMPKKWKSAALLFFDKKRKKFAKKFPGASIFELQKKAMKKFGELSQEKQQKFIDMEQQQKEEYKAAMKSLEEHHPDYFSNKSSPSSPTPKTTNACQLFVQENVKSALEKSSEHEAKDLTAKYKEKWTQLKVKKKVKFFKLALEAKEQYDKEIEEYREKHPDFKVPVTPKGFLTKPEWHALTEYQEKPQKPPQNSFHLFCKRSVTESPQEFSDMTFAQQSKDLAARWHEVSAETKQEYKDELEQMRTEYLPLLRSYSERVCDEEARLLNEEITAAEHAVSIATKAKDKTKAKPKSQENSDQKGKEKTKERKNSDQNGPFQGEPAKPPTTAFRAYVERGLNDEEFQTKLARQKRASSLWADLSTNEKRRWGQVKDEMVAEYEAAMRTFKQGLSDSNLEMYNETVRQREKKRTRKAKGSKSSGDDSNDDSHPNTPTPSPRSSPSKRKRKPNDVVKALDPGGIDIDGVHSVDIDDLLS